MFQPSGLLEALQKEFCEEKEEEGKFCTAQAFDRLNNYISKMGTLTLVQILGPFGPKNLRT